MVFIHDIDDKTKFIVLYQVAGMDVSRINKLTKIPLSTLYRWINRTENDEDITSSKEVSHENQTISPTIKKKVIRKARGQPARLSTRKIAAQVKIGKSSVDKILKEKGYQYGSAVSEKKLTNDQKKDRITFCEDMIKKRGQKLYQTVFSDEMGINLSDAYPKKGWAKPSKKIKYDKPGRDVRVNCWTGLPAVGAITLTIFEGPLNACRYQNILEEKKEEMDELFPDGYYFQHDIHPSHRSIEGRMGKESGFEFVKFPSDLNSIENFWAYLKNEVRANNLKTEKTLTTSLQKNWEKVTEPERLKNFF